MKSVTSSRFIIEAKCKYREPARWGGFYFATSEVALTVYIIIEEELLFSRALELFKDTGGASV
jgi:hypothetical protein